MAKYDITHACGHPNTINICGPVKLRQRQADFEAGKVCRECWLAEQRRKGEDAAATQAEAGLPELQGSGKQVAWAATIRGKLLDGLAKVEAQIDELIAKAGGEDKLDLKGGPSVAATRAAIDGIRNNPDARFWIENREREAMSILRDALRRKEAA